MKKYYNDLHKNARPILFNFARQLRANETTAESILWQRLRGNQLQGLKFRRQHPLRKFIADFYCHEKKLVIELDGSVHDDPEQQRLDEARTCELNQLAITVIRFRNEEIMDNIDKVMEKILEAVK